MRLLIDFAPIVVFVLVYYFAPETLEVLNYLLPDALFNPLADLPALALATAVLIPLTGLQVAITYCLWKKIENMHLISFFMVLILGSLTVILRDKTFIQWKPTLLNWLFAVVFLGSHYIGNKPIVERLMDSSIHLPKTLWLKLSYAWIVFFCAAGTANLLVANLFSEEFWVNFKLFGMLGLTLIFIVVQGIFLAPHLQQIEKNSEKTRD